MAGIDLNRTSSGVSALLPKEISSEIWATAVQDSVIMQASRQIAGVEGTSGDTPTR